MIAGTAVDLLSLGYWIALVLFLYFASKARFQRRFLAPAMAILFTCLGIAKSAVRFVWQDASLSYFLAASFAYLLILSLIFYFHMRTSSDKKSLS